MDATSTLQDALFRIQTDYVQMPQMKLTPRQVQRLWSLSAEICDGALSLLVMKGFLVRTSDGSYVRCGTRRLGVERPAALTRAS